MTEKLDERKRKLAIALAILESTSEDSTDDEILQILIKEKVLRPKHQTRLSLINSYSEEDVCTSIVGDLPQTNYLILY